MTEDEAKTKWCPFARQMVSLDNTVTGSPNEIASANRFHKGKVTLCLGSGCMAWRRQTVMIDRATGEPAIPGVTAIGALEERYSAHGFCGLAGQPS